MAAFGQRLGGDLRRSELSQLAAGDVSLSAAGTRSSPTSPTSATRSAGPNLAAKQDRRGDAVRVLIARRFEAQPRLPAGRPRIVREIAARYPQCRFLFAGSRQPGRRLRSIVGGPEELRDPRRAARRDAAALLGADVAVVPTLYSEGTSLSCIEAMCAASAVLVTGVGGLSNLVLDDYNGLLVPPTREALTAPGSCGCWRTGTSAAARPQRLRDGATVFFQNRLATPHRAGSDAASRRAESRVSKFESRESRVEGPRDRLLRDRRSRLCGRHADKFIFSLTRHPSPLTPMRNALPRPLLLPVPSGPCDWPSWPRRRAWYRACLRTRRASRLPGNCRWPSTCRRSCWGRWRGARAARSPARRRWWYAC